MNTRTSAACSCSWIASSRRRSWGSRGPLLLECASFFRRLKLQWNLICSGASSKTWGSALALFGGFFEYDRKKERLEEVSLELEDPAIWQDPAKAQELGKERARLTTELGVLDRTTQGTAEASE